METHEDSEVTNTLEACTFIGVYCGPTDNIQGTCKVFDVLTRKVKKVCNFTILPMPDQVIRLVNKWEQKLQHDDLQNKLGFLNRVKQKYDWDAEGSPDEGLIQENKAHPDIIAEILGIDLEVEHPGLDFAVEDDPMSEAELAQAAAANDSLYPIDPTSSTGVSTYANKLLGDKDGHQSVGVVQC